MKTLVTLGDSTVAAGRNLQIKKANRIEQLGAGWAGQLAGQLLYQRCIKQVFNLAFNGATITDMPEQLKLAKNRRADFLIIAIGINDFWLHSSSPEQLWQQYSQFVDSIDIPYLLVEPVAFSSVMKKPLVSVDLEQFQSRARQNLTNYIPMQSLLNNKGFSEQELLYDGIHPTAVGHQLFLQAVKAACIKQL